MSVHYEPGTEGLAEPSDDERDAVIKALQAALESFGKSMNELKRERDEAREALEYIAHAGLSARHIEDFAREFLRRKEAAK